MNRREWFNRYGGWILAVLSSAGVVTTSILAAEEIPKARTAIENEDDPTFWDKAKIIAKTCTKSLISGGLTISSIFANQALNSRQQAALIAAGAVGSKFAEEYNKYRRAIQAEQGEAVDKRALERAKMTEEELHKEITRLRGENGPYLYCFATLPGMVFEARPTDIMEAMLHFNRNLILRGDADLKELYTFIGIPTCCYDENESKQYGWNEFVNNVEYESPYCDFDIDVIYTKAGIPIRLVTAPIAPYDLYINYDDNKSTSDHFYPLYDPEKAKDAISETYQIPDEEIIPINHPNIQRTGII